jgi:hypothetical protein
MNKWFAVICKSCLATLMLILFISPAAAMEGTPVDSAAGELETALAKANSVESSTENTGLNIALPALALSLLLSAGSLKAYRRLFKHYEVKGSIITQKIDNVYREPFSIDAEAYHKLDALKKDIAIRELEQGEEIKALDNLKDSLEGGNNADFKK